MIDRSRLIDLFIELCSVNTPPRREKPLVDLVQTRLEGIGLRCARDRADRVTGGDSGNLIATLPGVLADAPSVFFSAHFDTVAPNPGVNIIRKNGVIRTNGSSVLGADDKCGLAAILAGIRCIVDDEIPHGEIQLLFSVCEEVGLLGARSIDRSLVTAEMGFVLDTGPPVGTVVYTAPTQDNLDITIAGKPAHAGFEPEKGISAIQVAARAIDRMRLGRIDEETTANVGVINGGSATNIVCPEVTMRAEARSRNPGKLQTQLQHMLDVLHEAAADFGAGIDVTVTRMYDGYLLSEEDEVIRIAQRAATAIGVETGLRAAGGGSDANAYNKMGLPTCVLATGMRAIHTNEEHIHEDDLVRSAEWVVAIVKEAAALAAGRDRRRVAGVGGV